MFLPVTMSSAEGIVETIKDIKEKIPSDPFEAELILMAEMVAEQDEGKSKEKRESKETDKSGPDGRRRPQQTPAYSKSEKLLPILKTKANYIDIRQNTI